MTLHHQLALEPLALQALEPLALQALAPLQPLALHPLHPLALPPLPPLHPLALHPLHRWLYRCLALPPLHQRSAAMTKFHATLGLTQKETAGLKKSPTVTA